MDGTQGRGSSGAQLRDGGAVGSPTCDGTVAARFVAILLAIGVGFVSCLVSVTRCQADEWLCGLSGISGFLACLLLACMAFDWAGGAAPQAPAGQTRGYAPTDRLILRGRSLEEGGGGIQ